MGGVDRADQLRGYYPVWMKCRKFYKLVMYVSVYILLACHTITMLQLNITKKNTTLFTYHYRYIFWFLLGCCITNAFVLYKGSQAANSSSRKAFKAFRLTLVQGLIAGYNSRIRYSLPAAIHDVAVRRSMSPGARGSTARTPDSGHFPARGEKARCCYCWNVKRRRHKSRIMCRRCRKAVCVEARDGGEASCFERWHLEGHSHA